MASFGFHPEAVLEFADATKYYLQEASPKIADSFVSAVESAIASIVATPTLWRVAEEPGIRRYVFRRFPYVLYYRWEAEKERVTIYAVMHCSREPGYWKHRLG